MTARALVPAPLSPERRALADAINLRAKRADHLHRIRQARDPARARAIAAADAVARAQQVLAEARAAAPLAAVAELIGSLPPAEPRASISGHITALTDAEAALDLAQRVSRGLGEEERIGQADLDAAVAGVDAAVRAVIAESPELSALAASLVAARDKIAIVSTIAHLLPPGTMPPSLWVEPALDAARGRWLTAEAAPWRAAVTALTNDPAAALPGDAPTATP